MPTQSNQANLIQLLRRIPPKWALAIVGVVLAYWLAQPLLNRSFGWNLPTIAAMLGESQAPPKVAAKKEVAKKSGSSDSSPSKSTSAANNSNSTSSKSTSASSKSSEPKDQESKSGRFLTEVGPDRFRSPAGLFYTRGSEEGHRLKHIAKHLEDQPTRPGAHGVFDGDLNQALHWIDEAYQKAMKGDRFARTSQEGESTKYEVTFDKPIGYVGGSDGKRKGNPPAKRLRLIVIGQNVITAFPF